MAFKAFSDGLLGAN